MSTHSLPAVSGVHAPDFVERTRSSRPWRCWWPLSLGFMPQTSLSDRSGGDCPHLPAGHLSLGFMPQTSLSGCRPRYLLQPLRPVSGVHAPDFVERIGYGPGGEPPITLLSLGGHAPDFVERGSTARQSVISTTLSLGYYPPDFVERRFGSARDGAPGSSVSGVHTPDFVEWGPWSGVPHWCQCCLWGTHPRLR